MYEDGIDVVYEQRTEWGWSEHRKLHMPGWCAGDPQMALALHLIGHRDAVDELRVTDWRPVDGRPQAEVRRTEAGTWEIHVTYPAGDYDAPEFFVNGDQAQVSW